MEGLTLTHSNKVFCLVGPSGVGKDTLKRELGLPYVISYRTRLPRIGEIEGVDGWFIKKEEFLYYQEQNLWIAETEYAGNYYGITQGEILALENSPMTYVIDFEGVLTLKETFRKLDGYSPDQVVSIFIDTPPQTLVKRMKKQGRRQEEIEERMIQFKEDFKTSSLCDHHIINDDLDKALLDIHRIILKESFNI